MNKVQRTLCKNHTDLSNPLGRLTQVKGQGDDHQIKGVIHSLGRCLQRVVTDDGTDYNRRTLRKSVDNMLEELLFDQHLI
jgi:hypothetical protein